MAKEDTIKAYLEEFMEGRSPEYREKFLAKSIDNQYASITGWNRRRKKAAGSSEAAPEEVAKSGFVSSVRKLRGQVVEVELTEKEIERLRNELTEFLNTLDNLEDLRRDREMKKLEKEAAKINRRIEALRLKKSK